MWAVFFVMACGSAFAQSLTVPSLWTRPTGDDWPRMLGKNFDGHSVESNLLTDWSKDALALRWSKPTGVGYGNAVISAGRAFQFDRYGDQERVTCYRAEDGTELWRWETPVEYEDMFGYNNGPRTSPVVDQDRVYVYGVAGTIACLDALTGREIWKADLNSKYNVVKNFFGVGSTPCVFEDRLLVMVGGSPSHSAAIPEGRLNLVKPNGSAMVAFDKQTGQELYRVGNDLASYSAPILANIKGKTWCLAFVREGLLVFDPRDGTRETFFPWRASILESVNAAWPVVDGNRILISDTYEKGSVCLSFDGEKLTPIWQDPAAQRSQAMRAHWATPIRSKEFLFGCSGRNEPDADFRCVRFESGEVQWVHRNRDRTTALLVDQHLVVLGEHGLLQLVKLNAGEFEVVAEKDFGDELADDGRPWLESPTWSPPALAYGLLFLRGQRRLICLELIPEAKTK
jgi:outer membrane protein assembly factor BamB